jgi:hypothetical protein
VFFDFVDDDKTIINHIGLVIRCSEKQIVTIEGNTSAAGGNQRNGGEVMVKSRALGARSFVVGYGRPNYELLPVIYRIDQKEKNNGASKSNCSIMGASYIAAALAVYMAGGTPKQIAMGGVAAVVPVICVG